jgi:glycerophosphoryl diester phosphodiesterase
MQPGAATVDGLSYPLVVAHRGGANLFPENTLAAYEGAVALGCRAVEAGDLQLTADGVLVAMHDATVDRTTDGHGNVGDLPLTAVRRLAVDASEWFGGGWADQPVPTFTEILDRVGGRAVLVPESKSVGTATTKALVEAVRARGLEDSVIVQSFRLDEVALVAAAGIAPLYLMHTGRDAPPSAIAQAGARFVGLDKDAADLPAVVAELTAAGLRVLAFTVDTQCEYDRVLAAGCDGVFTNEPRYAPRSYAYRTTRAPWPADGTFSSGMLVYPGVGPLIAGRGMPGRRGGFVGAPGAWRWALDRSPYLAGPLCPVAAAAGSYTVTVGLVYDRPPDADATRWGGLYFGVTSDDCPDDTDPASGYLVALRWNGTLEVFARTGTGVVSLGRTTTSPIVRPVLSADLAAGDAVTVLPVEPLPGALRAGHRLVLPTGQAVLLRADAAAGDGKLPVEEVLPTAAVVAGTALPQEVTIAVAKTPSGFTVHRTDDGAAATYEDATWSGGYLFLRNSRDDVAEISCSALTIDGSDATVSRNVVIHEHMGDPAGYAIAYADDGRFLVTRVADGAEIGRFETRVQAIAAAEADRERRY